MHTSLSHKKGVVLGCGTAGMSVIRYLAGQGLPVGLSDVNPRETLAPAVIHELEQLGVACEFGAHTETFIAAYDFVVPSPGVPLDLPVITQAQERGQEIVGELGLAAGEFTCPVLAVTGSNGKTTVTSLLGDILKQDGKKVFVGGNIGRPLLECFSGEKPYEAAVLELSSFQLELAGSFTPDVALVLNITPDHLNRHHTIEQYMAAKMNITVNQTHGDALIVGSDDPLLVKVKGGQGVDTFSFGFGDGATARVGEMEVELLWGQQRSPAVEIYALENTRLLSFVNRLNAAAAILAARRVGISQERIQRGLELFQPPLHRMTEVAVIDGVQYINDSKATNLGALQAALNGCTKPVVLIACGRDKGSDFTELQEVVSQKVRHLIVMGEAAGKLHQALGHLVPATQVYSMEEAVTTGGRMAKDGDMVLLAPGCASFDMFSSYEERGEVFMACVRKMAQKSKKEQVSSC